MISGIHDIYDIIIKSLFHCTCASNFLLAVSLPYVLKSPEPNKMVYANKQ